MVAVSDSPLLERDTALAACLQAAAGALGGEQRVVAVVAGPGLGKTRLLREVTAAMSASLRVLSAQGAALEQGVPFALLAQAFEHLLDGSVRGATAPTESRARAFARTVDELTAGRPTLLLVDDLHWADADSLALLAYLLRRTRHLPVAVIIALRPSPSPGLDLVADLVADGHAEQHDLHPLSDSGALHLLRRQLGDEVDDALATRMNTSCGGNPLLLEQLARTVGSGDSPDARSSATILLRRFAGMHGDDLAFLRAASVLGIEFRPEVAGDLADLPPAAVDHALQRIGALGLIQPVSRGRVRFAHPLFRQTLYDDQPRPVRERGHARAFDILLWQGKPESEAAEHALLGALVGDSRAIDVLESVAATARSAGATEVARQHLVAAIELSADGVRPQQLADLAETDMALGRVGDALDALQRLLAMPAATAHQRVRAMRRLGDGSHEAGRSADAADWFRKAAAEAEEFDADLAVEILLDHASLSQALPIPECLEVARRAQRLAMPGSDLAARADILAAFVAMLSGDPSEIPAADAAVARISADADSGWSWSSSLRNFAHLTYMIERFDDTDRALGAAMASARAHGAPFLVASTAFAWTDPLHRQARHAEMTQMLTLIDDAAAISPTIGWITPFVRAVTCWGAISSQESDDAVATVRAMFGDAGPWAFHAWMNLIRARQAMADARNHEASDLLLQVEALARDAGLVEPCAVPWASDAIRAHVSVGRRDDAERVLQQVIAGGRALPCLWPRIVRHTGAAAIAEHDGDIAGADDQHLRALALHAEARLPLDHVLTLIGYGTFQRRHGSIVTARKRLGEAVAIARDHGLVRLQHDAEVELRNAGGRRRRSGDIGGLTAQEARVCRLAVDGLTNVAIAAHLRVSTKTVETHLSHAYAKLGIRTRTELSAHIR